MNNVLQAGAVYEFGVSASDAPTISGMTARKVEMNREPEVYATAQDGEGCVDSVTLSKGDKFKLSGTASGYITDISAYRAPALPYFTFLGMKCFVKRIAEPRNKGEYVEGSVEFEAFAGVA